MKKLLCGLLAAAMLVGVCSFAACGPDKEDLEVVCPDGAPALALAKAFDADHDAFDFNIVDANKIEGYVTGAVPEADVCILPVNLASKLLGTGEVYTLLGTVTNGNLYFLTTGETPALEKEGLKDALLGKKVGVVQLTNVPGLTFKAVLADNDIPVKTLSSIDGEADADKVNLIPFTPDNVTPAGGCDYYLCPEPAASAKIKGTSSTPKPFKAAGDLQTLYGEGGYPQAVAVAKKTALSTHKQEVEKLIGYLKDSAAYLKTATPAHIIELLDDEREEGLSPSFNANNLTAEVIARCSVSYTASPACKDAVNAFLAKLSAIAPDFATAVEDAFYYAG